jgi:hypothetical protein
MSLFLAQTMGANTFQLATAQTHIISIARMDTGQGFSSTTTTIEGATCTEITYVRTLTGATSIRLDALVHDTGFTSPRQIIIMAVPSNFLLPSGVPVKNVAGQAFNIGTTGNPFASHICTIYDSDDCNGTGHWVDKEGGGSTSFPPDVILYHELAHCFHFATGVATTEPLAETDENDMRDARGLSHRDTSSHTGGCGGGPTKCCIVASLTTGSSYSEDIQRFRHLREQTLRHSVVGDDFFNEFFYRYYGFSPEITSLIGRRPNLRPLIKERFVMPLLASLEMLIFYADKKGDGLAKFLRGQARRQDLSDIYQKSSLEELARYLKNARDFDSKAISATLKSKGRQYSGFKELLRHISKETLRDDYIDWSLVAVVELWVKGALMIYSGKSEAEIDCHLNEKITRWIALMPVSKVWKEFSRIETEMELQSLEQFMFDPRSREIFSGRLIEKHPRHTDTILRWAAGREE